MAKKSEEIQDSQRQSRKEVLVARRQSRQSRTVRIIIGVVVGIIALVLVVAIINEYFIVPNRVVATVGEDEITLDEWQQRVRFQRAQFIISMEDQLEQFGDVGLVQQFSGQQMQLLQEGEELGRLVLEAMVDEIVVRQEAERRGITVSDAEIEQFIEEGFNYFDGGLPTPLPTGTATIMPTPSLTPIPTDVITDVLPTQTPFPTPTLGPTQTPAPTATPVSEESFNEQLQTRLDRFRGLGVNESIFRDTIEAQLYNQKLADALAEEQELQTEVDHVSSFVLSFSNEEDAQAGLAEIESDDFLTVWNRIRSTPPEADAENPPTAAELLWRTQEQFEGSYSAEIAQTVFSSELNTPTEILVVPSTTEGQPERYYIFMASGKELRTLPEATVTSLKNQLVADLVDQLRADDFVSISQFWRTRVPRQPILDAKFLVPPTAVPTEPPATLPPVTPTPEDDGT